MIKVKFEEYFNDNNKRFFDKSFDTWEDFQEYILGYSVSDFFLKERSTFPKKENGKLVHSVWEINKGMHYCQFLNIHLIESDRGIEYSHGTFTNSVKHISDKTMDIIEDCLERINRTEFNFVD